MKKLLSALAIVPLLAGQAAADQFCAAFDPCIHTGFRIKDPTFTGQVASADGTAAAPAYSFTGDTDTGVFRAGANLLGLSAGGTERVRVTADGLTLPAGVVIITPTAQTVADTGIDVTPAAFNVAATVGRVHVTCNDDDGCNATLLETGAVDGSSLTIVSVGTQTVNIADTASVSETAGAFAMGQYDSITFDYVSDRWVERNRSNN